MSRPVVRLLGQMVASWLQQHGRNASLLFKRSRIAGARTVSRGTIKQPLHSLSDDVALQPRNADPRVNISSEVVRASIPTFITANLRLGDFLSALISLAICRSQLKSLSCRHVAGVQRPVQEGVLLLECQEAFASRLWDEGGGDGGLGAGGVSCHPVEVVLGVNDDSCLAACQLDIHDLKHRRTRPAAQQRIHGSRVEACHSAMLPEAASMLMSDGSAALLGSPVTNMMDYHVHKSTRQVCENET